MIRNRRLADCTPEERRSIIDRPSVLSPEVLSGTRGILDAVRREGDAALVRFTRDYDGVDLPGPCISESEIAEGADRLPDEDRNALKAAWDRILAFHEKEVPASFRMEPDPGVTVGRRMIPHDRAGLYVPGGRAAYPTSVLMAAAPARVAKVPELVLCSPPGRDGTLPDAVLYAARLAGVDRIFRVGGSQAIAAMAYGTETVPSCTVIVGPGNAWVTAAKMLVRDRAAIDSPAGPSEILILSDGSAPASYLAADLLAQAEHDPEARCVLVTTDEEEGSRVAEELKMQIGTLDRESVVRTALEAHGDILFVESMDAAVDFANEYAAEHLTLACREDEAILERIRHAGAVFLGAGTPVATGDYGVGPNHILPTMGCARMVGGLSVEVFLRSVSYEKLSPEGLRRVAPEMIRLARLEGLTAHLRSMEIRLENEQN